MSDFNTKDALSNEIVIGKRYGYSQSKNGFTNVRLGVAKSFTPKGLLTLTEVESKRSLYNDGLEPEEHSGTCSVKPAMLFPIEEPLINKNVYVVTTPENGWDCVNAVFFNEADAKNEYADEDTFVIHEKRLI